MRLAPGVAGTAGAIGAVDTGLTGITTGGLVSRQFPEEALLSGLPLLLLVEVLSVLALAADGVPVAAAMSPSILALIFSRLAFHSSRKSAAALDLNPPVAMAPFIKFLLTRRA